MFNPKRCILSLSGMTFNSGLPASTESRTLSAPGIFSMTVFKSLPVCITWSKSLPLNVISIGAERGIKPNAIIEKLMPEYSFCKSVRNFRIKVSVERLFVSFLDFS